MKIAISNLAWDVSEDEKVISLLQKYGIDAIDVAPGKYFPKPKNANAQDIVRVREWWDKQGIAITGMQALLFGTTGLNLFGPQEVQAAMLDHLNAVCRIASGLGATKLVFGSPKNRDRSVFSDEKAHDMAVSFFRRLGDIAKSYGVVICLEPNPPVYGANFMMNCSDTAKIVSAVSRDAIRMQLDTGAVTINKEDPDSVIKEYASLIGHVHASEPNLVTLGDGGCDHAAIASALYKYLPDQIVAIEMLAAKNEDHLTAVERAIGTAVKYYRNKGES